MRLLHFNSLILNTAMLRMIDTFFFVALFYSVLDLIFLNLSVKVNCRKKRTREFGVKRWKKENYRLIERKLNVQSKMCHVQYSGR